MKKLFILFFALLTVLTGCNLLCTDESCTITTKYNQSQLNVSPSETIVSRGEMVALTYSTLPGIVITDIKVNGNSVNIPNGNTLYVTDTNSDRAIVEFTTMVVVQYYTVFASAGPGGRVSPSGEITVPKGQTRIFDFIANDGYFMDSLIIDTVCKKAPSGTNGIIYNFSADDTSHHTIRATFRKKEVYKISASANEYGSISPSGDISVIEGQNKTFTTTANEFCSLQKYVVDKKDVNPSSSYTFSEIDTTHTIDAVFVRDLEWYICKIKWISDSIYVDNHYLYVPGTEVLSFSSNGTYVETYNGKVNNRTWSINKTVTPPTLYCAYGVCTIEVLNDTKMVISTYTGTQKATYVYHGVLK